MSVTETDRDKDSEHWEEIRRFVGGANKAPKHPLVQEAERLKMRQPEHFDEGGMAGDFDINSGGSDTVKGLSPLLSSPIVPRGTPPALPGLPAAAPNATLPPPMPSGPGPAAPAGVPGPSAGAYDDKASKIMGGITPETIQRLMDSLTQESRRGQVGAGIAGIGDAIASVGGQNPGHMKNAEDLIQKNRETSMKVPGMMAEMGKERYGLSQELQAKDPASPFSKVTQNANRQLLKSMGASDADINTMPATAINDVVGHQVTLQEAMARIKQEGTYQQGMLENTKNVTQQNAAKTLEDRGIVKKATDAVGDLFDTDASKARATLQRQATGQPTNQPFNHAAIAPGETYQAPDGSWRRKK